MATTEVMSQMPPFSSQAFMSDEVPSLCENDLNLSLLPTESQSLWAILVQSINELKPLLEGQLTASDKSLNWEQLQYRFVTILNEHHTDGVFSAFVNELTRFNARVISDPLSRHNKQALNALALQLSYADSFSFEQIYQDVMLSNQGVLHTHLQLRARLLFETVMQSERGFERHGKDGNIKAESIKQTLGQIGKDSSPDLEVYLAKNPPERSTPDSHQSRMIAILGKLAPRMGIDYKPAEQSTKGRRRSLVGSVLGPQDDELLHELQERCTLMHVIDFAAQILCHHMNCAVDNQNFRFAGNPIAQQGVMHLVRLQQPNCNSSYDAYLGEFVATGFPKFTPEGELKKIAMAQQKVIETLPEIPSHYFSSNLVRPHHFTGHYGCSFKFLKWGDACNPNYQILAEKIIPRLPEHAVEPCIKQWIRDTQTSDARELVYFADCMCLYRTPLSQAELEYVAALKRRILKDPELKRKLLELCNETDNGRTEDTSKGTHARRLMQSVGIQVEVQVEGGVQTWVESEEPLQQSRSQNRRNRNDNAIRINTTSKTIKQSGEHSNLGRLLELAQSGELDGLREQLENTGTLSQLQMAKGNGLFFRHLLHMACRHGHCNVVKYLIEQPYVNINAQDDKGKTALHIAVEIGDVSLVKLLTKSKNINLKVTDSNGYTSLHLACASQHQDGGEMATVIAKCDPKVLSQCSLPVVTEFENNVRNVSQAAQKLENTFGVKQFHHQLSAQRITPLQQCLLSGQIELATQLANQNQVKLIQMTTSRNNTLHLLASLGKKEELSWVLSNAKDAQDLMLKVGNSGFTPLQLAVAMNDVLSVNAMLESDACVRDCTGRLWRPQGNGFTLLQLASRLNNAPMMQSLASSIKVDLNGRDNAGNHILHTVFEITDPRVVSEQISAINLAEQAIPLSLDATNNDKRTFMHLAACQSSQHVVHALALAGESNINSILSLLDKDGDTAIHNAIKRGYDGVIKAFRQNQHCSLNVVDSDQNSALMLAVHLDQTAIITELLKSDDLDLTVLNNCQENVFHLVCRIQNVAELGRILDYLRDHQRAGWTLVMQQTARSTLDNYVATGDEENRQCTRNLVNRQNADAQTPLHIACQTGNIALVQKLTLLRSGGNNSAMVNTSLVDNNKQTPLHIACAHNYTDIAMLIVGVSDRSMFTPESDHLFEVKPIIVQSEQTVRVVEEESSTEETHSDPIFLDDCLMVNVKPDAQLEDSPLHLATRLGNQDVVNAIVNAYPGYAHVPNAHGITPFQIAFKKGIKAIIDVFKTFFKMKVGKPTPQSDTQLHDVIRRSGSEVGVVSEDFESLLIECTLSDEKSVPQPASPRTQRSPRTRPMGSPTVRRIPSREDARGLYGISINARDDCGDTALHVAIEKNRPDLALKILQCQDLSPKLNPNVRNANGQTPLDLILKEHLHDLEEYEEVVYLLFFNGAEQGQNPDWLKKQVIAAIEEDNKPFLTALLRHCTQGMYEDTFAVKDWRNDSDGNTLFHLAVQHGNAHAIEVLNQLGISTNNPNTAGDLPIHLAITCELSLDKKISCAQQLIKNPETSLYSVDAKGNNALHLAALHEPYMLRMLISSDVTPPPLPKLVEEDDGVGKLVPGTLGINEPHAQGDNVGRQTVLELALGNLDTHPSILDFLVKQGATGSEEVRRSVAAKLRENGYEESATNIERCTNQVVDSQGNNVLHRLCEAGDLFTLRYLLSHHRETYLTALNQTNDQGFTPLHLAIYNNEFTCVIEILKIGNQQVDIGFKKHVNGNNVFQLAMRNYHNKKEFNFRLFNLLIGFVKSHAECSSLLLERDSNGYTLLHHLAASNDNLVRISDLLEIQPQLLLMSDPLGVTPLLKAVLNQQNKYVRAYISCAVGSQEDGCEGLAQAEQTGLLTATLPVSVGLDQVLIPEPRGPEDEQENQEGDLSCPRLYLPTLVNPNDQTACTVLEHLNRMRANYEVIDPMLAAVVLNNTGISDELHRLAAQCYPDARLRRYKGCNLLHIASKHSNSEMVIHLINLEDHTYDEFLVMNTSGKSHYYDLCELDDNGDSILHLCIKHNRHVEMVHILHGTNSDVALSVLGTVNRQGQSPEAYAKTKKERMWANIIITARQSIESIKRDEPISNRQAPTQSAMETSIQPHTSPELSHSLTVSVGRDGSDGDYDDGEEWEILGSPDETPQSQREQQAIDIPEESGFVQTLSNVGISYNAQRAQSATPMHDERFINSSKHQPILNTNHPQNGHYLEADPWHHQGWQSGSIDGSSSVSDSQTSSASETPAATVDPVQLALRALLQRERANTQKHTTQESLVTPQPSLSGVMMSPIASISSEASTPLAMTPSESSYEKALRVPLTAFGEAFNFTDPLYSNGDSELEVEQEPTVDSDQDELPFELEEER